MSSTNEEIFSPVIKHSNEAGKTHLNETEEIPDAMQRLTNCPGARRTAEPENLPSSAGIAVALSERSLSVESTSDRAAGVEELVGADVSKQGSNPEFETMVRVTEPVKEVSVLAVEHSIASDAISEAQSSDLPTGNGEPNGCLDRVITSSRRHCHEILPSSSTAGCLKTADLVSEIMPPVEGRLSLFKFIITCLLYCLLFGLHCEISVCFSYLLHLVIVLTRGENCISLFC